MSVTEVCALALDGEDHMLQEVQRLLQFEK